jgi:hypothetical protein
MRKIKGKHARLNRPAPHLTLDQRLTRMSQCRGMHVAYSPGMLAGRIDREAWAREIDTLMLRFDPGTQGEGNKSAFARRIGMTRQTLKRWAACETDISPESVGQVLDRLDLSPEEQTDLLTRIGYFAPTATLARPTYPDPGEDPVIQQIMANPRITEDQRAELVKVQLDLIEADVQRRQAEYDRLMGYQERRDAS